jgi:hypothetical protein
MNPFSRPAFRDTFVWKYGWRLIQKSRSLSEVLRYRKPVFAIDCHAVEISWSVAGAHKHSELREYVTVWNPDGTFKHHYPSDEPLKEI